MDFLNILAIAVALAMDAFAVSIAAGLRLKTVNARQVFRLSWHFGLFQALMPLIGWSGGYLVRGYIEQYDHWVAFGLLAFVGGHMLKEAFDDETAEHARQDPTKGLTMVMLSVAVSIDALAVGLSLAVLRADILFPALMIGIVAFVTTIAGLRLGTTISEFSHLHTYAEVLGGVVLIGIGLKILWEHGVFTL